jgi:flagellar hook-associated protein 2
MADVSFSGLSSGIDTAALIKALVEVKRQPITSLQKQSDAFQASVTRLSEFASKLTALRSAASTLASSTSFSAFSSSSSDTDVIGVATSSTASEGNHTVTVQQLAAGQTSKSSETSVSADSAFGLAGTLRFTPAGSPGVSVPDNLVTIAAGDSLNAIRDKINNSTPTAYGSLNFLAVPTTGTKLAVDDKTYEFYDSAQGAYSGTNVGIDINGAADGAAVAARVAAAASGSGTDMSVSGAVVTVKAKNPGSGGNLIGMTNTTASGGTDGAIQLSGAKLSGGLPAYSASVINTGTATAPAWTLVLTGKGMGEISAFTAAYTPTVPGDPKTLTFSNTQNAKDAIIDIDGMTGVHRSTNVINDVVSGVTLNLVSAPAAKPAISIGVSKDNGAIREKVQAFLKAFNDLASYIRTNASYDPATKTAGPLLGDSSVSTVSNGLRSIMGNAVSGLGGNFTALSRVGIKTNADGTMSMDAGKFDAAMSADFRGVVDLFTKNLSTGTKGVASQVSERIDRWLSPVDGMVSRRKSTLQDSITRLAAEMEQKDSAAKLYEQSLKVKYSNMEQLISTLKNQSGALNNLGAY